MSVFEEGTWNEPAAIPRQFDIFFPVTWAAKQPDVEFIGRFGLPTEYLAPVPLRYPLRKISTGAVVGWMIIEGESRRKVTELSEAEHHYTYAFAVNIPRLAELFCLKWNAAEPFPD